MLDKSSTRLPEAPTISGDRNADADAAIDSYLIASLDFDAGPLCESSETLGGKTCGAPASWILILSCGHSIFYCESHHRETMAFLASPGDLYCGESITAPHHPPYLPVGYEWRRTR